MFTEKSFWLPKIPCIYGFTLCFFHFSAAFCGSADWETFGMNILFTIPYILMNAALPVYLCRYSDRGAEPLWFAAVHWGLIFLSGLLVLISVAAGAGEAGLGGFLAFVFALLTAPLFPFYALFPWVAPVAVCVYAGLLTFFFVRGLYRTKHSRQK